MIVKLLLVLYVAMTISACRLFPGDPDAGRTLAMTLVNDGSIAFLYKPCTASTVESIRFALVNEGLVGDDDDDILWEIRATELLVMRGVSFLTVGATPDGFEEVVPFEPAFEIPLDTDVYIEIETDRYDPYEVFELEELRQGLYLTHRNDYVTMEQFTDFDTCDH